MSFTIRHRLRWTVLTAASLALTTAPAAARAQSAMASAGLTAASPSAEPPAQSSSASTPAAGFLGFDRNPYPGDDALPTLHRHFAFAGYWLNLPPGARSNGWTGKRDILRRAGFGFLLLWNGRLDREILAAQHRGTTPARLGEEDAAAAVAAVRREGFPANAIVFLDQEEGGRMLPEQAGYLLAWTEAVARTGFRPGVYASGQPVDEGPAPGGSGRQTITTAQDITDQVRAQHLHPVVLWVAQDACPPANGCSLTPPSLADSGTPGAAVWQYAQSPRRPAITRACARTYAADGNCAPPEPPALFLDLDIAATADPSSGR